VLCDEKFDSALGDGASGICRKELDPRWNFNGISPPGRKVGLLDEYQLWACLCDPFSRRLSLDFAELVEGGVNGILTNMLKWAVPGDSDAEKEKRSTLMLEFTAFHTATGPNALSFDEHTALPEGHVLTLPDVMSWVSSTGGHESRLAWFLLRAPKSPFFLEIAKPLLSVRITGSMTVERVAKPLKNSVLSSDRHQLSPGKAEMLLLAGLNLRFLHAAKETLRGAGF
jgi:hypothetical protein